MDFGAFWGWDPNFLFTEVAALALCEKRTPQDRGSNEKRVQVVLPPALRCAQTTRMALQRPPLPNLEIQTTKYCESSLVASFCHAKCYPLHSQLPICVSYLMGMSYKTIAK